MKWAIIAFAVGISASGKHACAEAPAVLSFAEKVHQITTQNIDQLLAYGIRDVFSVDVSGNKNASGFDLSEFRTQLALIDWVDLGPEDALPAFIGSRRSAYFTHHKVHISQRLSGHSSEDLALIGIHESLGALGYNDADYQVSTALWFLSGEERPNVREWFVSTTAWIVRISQRKQKLVQMAGGSGTMVGGGGDLYAAIAKARTLKEILKQRTVLRSYYLNLVRVAFEPDYAVTGVTASAKMEGDGRLTIFVPVVRWMESSEKDRVEIVDQIAKTLLDYYPGEF